MYTVQKFGCVKPVRLCASGFILSELENKFVPYIFPVYDSEVSLRETRAVRVRIYLSGSSRLA